jgi:protease PrsW
MTGGPMELLGIAAYLALSAFLSTLFLTLVWLADRYEREPWWLVMLAAAWGAVPAVFLSCVAEFAVNRPLGMALGSGPAEVLGTVLVAPPVEEVVKALALLLIVTIGRQQFDDVLDGMVYGAAVGVGFSFVEDAFYFLGSVSTDGLGGAGITFVLRNIAFVLNHSLFSAVTGIGFGLARLYHRNSLARFGWPLVGLTFAILLHMAHNSLALLQLPGLLAALILHWAGGLGLLVLVPVLWSLQRAWVVARLRLEIGEGHIPAEALSALPFAGPVRTVRLPGPVQRQLRGYLLQLAFHRKAIEEGWTRGVPGELENLRARISAPFRPRP